jgi:multicomponent Na+:H+ antiporter subunit E
MRRFTTRGERELPVLGFFALHLLLTLLWMALMGWGGAQVLAGLAIGFLAISLSARLFGSAAYARSVWAVMLLIALFLFSLIKSNLQLARDILRRTPRFAPAILAFDISSLGLVHIGLLINLVSLTPGTLSIDIDGSGKILYVHTLYFQDQPKARGDIRRYSALLEVIAGAPSVPREPR